MSDQLPFAEYTIPGAIEASPRYEYAPTMRDLQFARDMGREAVRISAAWGELGGGVDCAQEEAELADRFGRFIDDYEPWKRDIAITFDQFNMTALQPDDINAMTKEDRKELALHFDDHVSRLESRGKVLATPGSAADVRFGDYSFDNEAVAIEYGHELSAFTRVIKETPAYDMLHSIAMRERPDAALRKRYVRNDVKKHGALTVVYDTKSNKLRVLRENSLRS